MEEFLVVIYFICFIWGILNIILFFKVWGMTSDIREMKNIFISLNKKQNMNFQEIKNKEIHESDANLVATKVNWNHKFQIGDMVRYKPNGKTLYIAQILANEYEYKCKDADGNFLSAVFFEKELY